MGISYDTIWECFVDNCGVDQNTLPKTNEGKYILIKNGIRHYNKNVDEDEAQLIGTNETESVNLNLDNTRLLLLAYCMRYTILENEAIKFEQLWQPFTRDVGQKYYRDQITARNSRLYQTKNEINGLLNKLDTFSYME